MLNGGGGGRLRKITGFLLAALLGLLPMANSFAGETVIIPNGLFSGPNAHGNSLDGSGNAPDADPNDNVLIIDSGSVDYAYGAWTDTPGMVATGNSVLINGGTVTQLVTGGQSNGNSFGNSVTLNGGLVDGTISGGVSTSGNVNGNSVTINGGSVKFIYGGSTGGTGNASGNSVLINSGTVVSAIMGGASFGGGDATHNTVTISGNAVLADADILGGFGNGIDQFTGNTLNVCNYTSASVGSVSNFEFYNFLLPSTQSGPVLITRNPTILGDGTKPSIFTVSSNGGTPWQPGQEITLISDFDSGNFKPQATGQHGATLSYDWELGPSGSGLVAELKGVSTERAKSLSEGFLAGTALLNQTGDLIVKQTEKGDGIFFDMAGNWSRYDTGSHVDLTGLSLLTGYSRRARVTPGCLTYGAFFEYGTGSYDTFNSFGTVAAFRNNGNANHFGGGVLGRLDFRNCFYADGSLRAGGLSNHFKGGDLKDPLGNTATFDSKTAYYSMHFGAGRLFNFSKCASLDLYGRYFWTHQQGDTITLSTLDPVKFSDVNSHRLRFGSRLGATNRVLNPYVGAAYEYEFDGEARASTYGYAIDAPTLQGSTGIGELGLDWKPCRNFSIDLGVQGYVGTRQGGAATLMAGWMF